MMCHHMCVTTQYITRQYNTYDAGRELAGWYCVTTCVLQHNTVQQKYAASWSMKYPHLCTTMPHITELYSTGRKLAGQRSVSQPQCYSTIQYNTIQYTPIQYSALQYNAIQYNTGLEPAGQRSVTICMLHYTTVQYSTILQNAGRKPAG